MSKLKTYKKISAFSGTILLIFLAFLSRDLTHTILVDILSATVVETIEAPFDPPIETTITETSNPDQASTPDDIIPDETSVTSDIAPIATDLSQTDISIDADPSVATPDVTGAPPETTSDCTDTITDEIPPVADDTPPTTPSSSSAESLSSAEAPKETPPVVDAPQMTNPVQTEELATPLLEKPTEDLPVVSTETITDIVSSVEETPSETITSTSDVTTPEEVDAAHICIPKQATALVPEPIKTPPVTENPIVKKVEQNIPFVDLSTPKPTIKKEIIIDSAAAQSCDAESFHVEIQRGHSQVIPLLLQSSGSTDNSVEIGDVPKGAILTFVANGLMEITGISFDNLMISADIAPDAQTGSFNVPIIYSITSKNEVSHAMCQLNLVIQ